MKSYKNLGPAAVRALIREGTLKCKHTAGYCGGYLQANVAIIPQTFSADFSKFCSENSAPLPLLYESKPGELGCPPLAKDVNIATDLPGYFVFKDGQLSEKVNSLVDFDLQDYCSFYLGCSFSFEEALFNAGVRFEDTDVGHKFSVFHTSVALRPFGPFKGNLVVSMRPVPSKALSKMATIASAFENAHGAPIHIGDPTILGITDITRPDFGEPVKFMEGDVPVFWACGVTNSVAVTNARLPLAFTHEPGMMFVSDIEVGSPEPLEEICVVPIEPTRSLYGILGKTAKNQLVKIESLISQDRGKRGIDPLRIPEDFIAACLALSSANRILITTGFACHTGSEVPYENDGPSGVLSLAFVLLGLGKMVTMVVDGPLAVLMEKAVAALINSRQVPLDDLKILAYKDVSPAMVDAQDVLVACERSAPGFDGNYYTMKARALPRDQFIDPIETIFKDSNKLTVGIGDGGNELGMGKVADRVKTHVNNGEIIASSIATDLLITAGVSNWGAWGLGFGVLAVAGCRAHDRAKRRGLGQPSALPTGGEFIVPSVQSETKIEEMVEHLGMMDGICKKAMHVDGMPFGGEHVKMVEELLDVLNSK